MVLVVVLVVEVVLHDEKCMSTNVSLIGNQNWHPTSKLDGVRKNAATCTEIHRHSQPLLTPWNRHKNGGFM